MSVKAAYQQGVALLSVLLVVAIVMAVAARLMSGHGLTISQNQNVFEQNQALQYVLGAEALAIQALYQDFLEAGEVDHLGEFWAQPVPPFELDEGGFLEAQVSDKQGCFNMNRLRGSDATVALEQLKRMFNNLGVQPGHADAWKDWVDEDELVTGFGAEDSEYLIADIPHRTPNTMVTDISELALLNNISPEEVDLIRPEVCLLPSEESQVNVNTATMHTLAALSDEVSPATLEGIDATPREYASVDEFVTEYTDFESVAAQLTVVSQYYELHAFAQVGDSSVTLLSTLGRDSSSGQVTVLSRNFGKLFRSSLSVDVSTDE